MNKKLLYVNGCIRDDAVSRTARLGLAFREGVLEDMPDAEWDTLILRKEALRPLSARTAERRALLAEKGDFTCPMFRYARQFADADLIVIAAPYWDMSFPALLKVYIENVCVPNLTFRNTKRGTKGLCRFRDLVFLTTAGGYLRPEDDAGLLYLSQIASFLGNGRFLHVAAEGLDVKPREAGSTLRIAEDRARLLGKSVTADL